MTDEEAFRAARELPDRELLLLVFGALRRQGAQQEANHKQLMGALEAMTETEQQTHDEMLAEEQQIETQVEQIEANQATLGTAVTGATQAVTDLQAWVKTHSNPGSGGSNLVDWSDLKAIEDKLATHVGNIAANVQSETAGVSTLAADDPGPVPDFSLALAPATLSVAQGTSGTASITSTAIGGFSDNVVVAPVSLPAGVTLDADSYTVPAGGSATITVSADATAATPGDYTIAFDGTDGELSHDASLSLTITAAAAPAQQQEQPPE